MTTTSRPRGRRPWGTIAALSTLLAVAVMPAQPAEASSRVRHNGYCSNHVGQWKLIAERVDGGIGVTFAVEHVRAHQTWQVFVSDNGQRILAASRVSDSTGEFRVYKKTANRAGYDHFSASALNTVTGVTCRGALIY